MRAAFAYLLRLFRFLEVADAFEHRGWPTLHALTRALVGFLRHKKFSQKRFQRGGRVGRFFNFFVNVPELQSHASQHLFIRKKALSSSFCQFGTSRCSSTNFNAMFSRKRYSVARRTAERRFFSCLDMG